MQLNPAAFNAHLAHMGEWFNWRKSFACPCLNPNSGSPRAGCPNCSGKGHLWPGAGIRCVAGVASSKTQQEWARSGLWVSGDTVLTIPENSPMYDIGQFDRVVAESNTDPFSMPLIRGAPTERIHGSVKSIDRVFWYDADNDLVEGGIPTVAANGALTWGDGAPPAGQTYSISGVRLVEWYCFGQFAVDRMKHGGARLPRRMVLRKFDLLGRNGSL